MRRGLLAVTFGVTLLLGVLSLGPFPPGTAQLEAQTTGGPNLNSFLRGDCNSDNLIDAADIILLLQHLFVIGGPTPSCRDACDVDDSGVDLNLIDVSFMLAFMFDSGDPPPPPFPVAAVDPTPGDGIGCDGDDDDTPVVNGSVLIPGPGFSGATPQPSDVGSGSNASVKAIARFDVVPYQTFGGTFDIGVTAFHIRGIDRVEFSVEGGPWSAVVEPRLNNRTGVFEYVATVDASLLPTGPIEVRAIAYPEIGRARVLSLRLFANAAGAAPNPVRYISPNGSDSSGDGSSSNPFRTARKAGRDIQASSSNNRADGGTIFLMAGNNILEDGGASVDTQHRWLELRPAPGLTQSQVVVHVVNDSLETKLMRMTNLTIRRSISSGHSSDNINSGAEEAYFWADHCRFVGNGPNTQIGSLGFVADTRFNAYYATDSIAENERHGLRGASLLRNVIVQNIGSDAFQNTEYILNCSVDGISNNVGWHPDLVQYTRGLDNVIIYGLHAVNVRGQGIFAKPTSLNINNVALVNLMVEVEGGYKSEWEPNSDHILMWNNSYVNHTFLFTGTGANHVSIRNNFFEKFLNVGSGWVIDNNHYRNGTGSTPGTNTTTGGSSSAMFMDPGGDDYRPVLGQPIAGQQRPTLILSPLAPADSLGNPWSLPASVGALAH